MKFQLDPNEYFHRIDHWFQLKEKQLDICHWSRKSDLADFDENILKNINRLVDVLQWAFSFWSHQLNSNQFQLFQFVELLDPNLIKSFPTDQQPLSINENIFVRIDWVINSKTNWETNQWMTEWFSIIRMNSCLSSSDDKTLIFNGSSTKKNLFLASVRENKYSFSIRWTFLLPPNEIHRLIL